MKKTKKQKLKVKFYIFLFALMALGIGLFFCEGLRDFLRASLFVDNGMEKNRNLTMYRLIDDDLAEGGILSMDCDVVIVGGGAGGVAAGIQSARLGTKTCIIEETDWLGGMLSSAGVSAIDGRTDTPSGIFKEFLTRVENYYKTEGKESETKECSVSYFCFEPHVADMIFKEMVKEISNLKVYYNSKVEAVYRNGDLVTGIRFKMDNRRSVIMKSKILVDATEFGDIMYLGNIPYDLGPDENSNEPHADEAESCIQPLTYVAVLKKYDYEVPMGEPDNYEEANYKCLVKNEDCPDSNSSFDFYRLTNYGLLPNDKLMINIPSHSYGNDFHATADDLDNYSREEILEMAKDYSRGLIYYLRETFGVKNYAIYDEFDSSDGFAKIPYVRESRRLKGAYRMDEWDLLPDADGQTILFKHAIAIGDYPIDLHFCDYGKGDIFYKVAPYQIPYEVTIPQTVDGFMVAEKNISVSHIVNGTTRLQPVVMSVGQAVGAGAALAVQTGIQPRDVDIEKVQDILVDAGSQIFYFAGIPTSHYANKYVNKLALEGIVSAYDPISKSPEKTITKTDFSSLISSTYKAVGDKISTPVEDLKFDTYFDANTDGITRAKLADFLSTNIFKEIHGSTEYLANFKDITPYTTDYYNVNKLLNLGIVSSINTTFRPNEYTTRGEFITILGRTVDYLNMLTVTYNNQDSRAL